MDEQKTTIPRFRMEGGVAVINDPSREKIRAMVSNIYGIQKLRIQCGNRMVASYMQLGEKSRERVTKAKEAELDTSTTDEDADDKFEDKGVSAEDALKDDEDTSKDDAENLKKIKKIMTEYQKITDYIKEQIKSKSKDPTNTRSIRNKDIEKAINQLRSLSESESRDIKPSIELIGEVYDYMMADQYQKLIDLEKSAVRALEDEVEKHPLWEKFFKDVRGCGPIMAAVCISYFDPYRARHISSFWKYAGLDVVINEDGTAEGRSRKHTEKQVYYDKNNKPQEKIGITYNPKLKSKLLGVLGSGFLKAGRAYKGGPVVGYAKIYYDYKNRLENRADADTRTPKHTHNMAVRYAVKMFVRDLWVAWRTLEGLEVTEPYEVAYLGRKPHGYNSSVINKE